MSSITCCAPASSSATRAMMPAAGSTARRTTTRVNAVAPSSTTATTTKTFTVTTKKTATVATTATTTTTAAAAAAVAAVMTWAPQATAATTAAAVFEVSEDVFASTGVGPAACALATVFIGYSVFSGYAEINRLKAELTEEGYDVEEFTRVGELKAIRNAVDEGTIDSVYDKVWYQRCVMAAGSGSIVDVQKAQAYWKGKGINVKTLADIDKVPLKSSGMNACAWTRPWVAAYMVKKYGKDGKLNGKAIVKAKDMEKSR